MVIGSLIRVTLPESVSFGIKRERTDVFWLSALSRRVRLTTSWGFFCLAMAIASSIESGVAIVACKVPKSKQIVTVRFIVSNKITNTLVQKRRIWSKWRFLLLNGCLFSLDGKWALFCGNDFRTVLGYFLFSIRRKLNFKSILMTFGIRCQKSI